MQREDSYERDHFPQEEHPIRCDILRCSADIAALQGQINLLDLELALL